jgi:hypothetical protein
MVSAISPAVLRGKGFIAKLLFVMGAISGGIVLGIAAAWVAAIASGVALWPRGAVALALLVLGLALPLPPFHRQVSRRDQARLLLASFRWGLELGMAFITTPVSRALLLFAGVAVAVHDPGDAFLLGLFGPVRGLATLWLWRPSADPDAPVMRGRLRFLTQSDRAVHLLGSAIAAMAAVAAIVAVFVGSSS